jgi:hypothetical protein
MGDDDLHQSVPHGEAPGDAEREKATVWRVKIGDDTLRYRICGDLSGGSEEWIAAEAESTTTVVEQR